jgi:hypothetical protein
MKMYGRADWIGQPTVGGHRPADLSLVILFSTIGGEEREKERRKKRERGNWC